MEEYGKETISRYCRWQYLPVFFAILSFISGIVSLCAGTVSFAESELMSSALVPPENISQEIAAQKEEPVSESQSSGTLDPDGRSRFSSENVRREVSDRIQPSGMADSKGAAEENMAEFQSGSGLLEPLGFALPEEFHSWGNFEPGAWTFSRTLIEGRRGIRGSSKTVVEMNSVLHEKRTDLFSIMTESSLLLSGKNIQQKPKTVSVDFLGLSLSEKHTAEELDPVSLEVEGQSILCRVVKVSSVGEDLRRETRFWINETKAPYLFRKERTTWRGKSARPCETVRQWVTLRSVQFSLLGKVLNGYQYSVRAEYPTYISTSNVVASFSIPGRIVTQVTHETDLRGRPLQEISREVLDFGKSAREHQRDIPRSSARSERLIIMPDLREDAASHRIRKETENEEKSAEALEAGPSADPAAANEEIAEHTETAESGMSLHERRLLVVEFSAEAEIEAVSGAEDRDVNDAARQSTAEIFSGFLPDVSFGHLNSLDLSGGRWNRGEGPAERIEQNVPVGMKDSADSGTGTADPFPTWGPDGVLLQKFRTRWQFGKELQELEDPEKLKLLFPHLQFDCWQEKDLDVPGADFRKVRTLSPIYEKNLRDSGRSRLKEREKSGPESSDSSRNGNLREMREWKPLAEIRKRVISTQALREEARPEPEPKVEFQTKKEPGTLKHHTFLPILQRILMD